MNTHFGAKRFAMKPTYFLILALVFAATRSQASAPQKASSPKRIVSLFTGADEILWELLPKDQKHRIAGLSAFAKKKSYSELYDKLPKSIPLTGLSNEFLLNLKPDFVIARNE